jgi:hypothetical protein
LPIPILFIFLLECQRSLYFVSHFQHSKIFLLRQIIPKLYGLHHSLVNNCPATRSIHSLRTKPPRQCTSLSPSSLSSAPYPGSISPSRGSPPIPKCISSSRDNKHLRPHAAVPVVFCINNFDVAWPLNIASARRWSPTSHWAQKTGNIVRQLRLRPISRRHLQRTRANSFSTSARPT